MPNLRQYQVEDILYLSNHDSHGIFNEQRTGKTPTSLTAMCVKTEGKILIISTASMVYRWRDEVLTWTDRHPFVYEGNPKQRERQLELFNKVYKSVLIVSYGLLKNTKAYTGIYEQLKKIDIQGLIVDEVHRAVGRDTQNFKALRSLVKIPHRYYLTGTPAPNHPSQVWSILTMIDPKRFSSYWKFVEQFFYIEQIRLPYSATVDHIKQPSGFLPGKEQQYVDLLNELSIMRKRKEVMPWLLEEDPHTKIRLPLTTYQSKQLYEMQKYYETGHVIAQGVLDQLLRYRQICLAPQLLGLKGNSPKIEWIEQYLKDYPEKKVVIFSKFTSFLHLLLGRIPHVGLVVGETPAKERNDLISSFQHGTLQVLAIQIDAGKEGITLDNADVLIFTDIFPPASDILQAKDRIVATSKERNKPKEIIELMMADSYDEALYDIVAKKVELTDIANNYIKYLQEREW